jgi:hypothetical protein
MALPFLCALLLVIINSQVDLLLHISEVRNRFWLSNPVAFFHKQIRKTDFVTPMGRPRGPRGVPGDAVKFVIPEK